MQITPEELSEFQQKSDQLFINPDRLHINFDIIIGQGSCSTVYRGHLIGPSPFHILQKSIDTQKFIDCNVAVKVARRMGPGEAEQLYKEIQAMKMIGYNENIMSMLGWGMVDETPCLVFDIAQRSLLDYVREVGKNVKDEDFKTPYNEFLSILWQVTKGMSFVSSKRLVHRDLAARNILLCEGKKAKISDFGLCCTCDDNFTYQATVTKKLPIKWLSMEALKYRIFSEKSDVWAFGVMMYEVYSFGIEPYSALDSNELLDFLERGRRLEKPDLALEEIYEIMNACWKDHSSFRPTFEQLEKMLCGMLEKLAVGYEILMDDL